MASDKEQRERQTPRPLRPREGNSPRAIRVSCVEVTEAVLLAQG